MKLLLATSEPSEQDKIIVEAAKHGFEIDAVTDGITAIKFFRRKQYSLAIIDGHLLELDGLIVCRQFRKTSAIPIVILSSKSREFDRLAAFEAGADDYVLKPYFATELFARVKAILKRCGSGMNMPVINVGGIAIHTDSRAVYVDERVIALTPKEYELLLFLSQNINIALSRDTILLRVWGEDFEGVDRTVDSHIKALRANIKPYDNMIVSVWGYGYKLEN